MGAGPFSSDSKTSSNANTNSGPLTATGGSLNISTAGGKGQQVILGGVTIQKVGKGATVTLSAPPDTGGLQAVSAALERALSAQADNTAASLASIGNLAETRISDGANISADVSKTGFAFVAFLGAVAFVALLFIFRKRS